MEKVVSRLGGLNVAGANSDSSVNYMNSQHQHRGGGDRGRGRGTFKCRNCNSPDQPDFAKPAGVVAMTVGAGIVRTFDYRITPLPLNPETRLMQTHPNP